MQVRCAYWQQKTRKHNQSQNRPMALLQSSQFSSGARMASSWWSEPMKAPRCIAWLIVLVYWRCLRIEQLEIVRRKIQSEVRSSGQTKSVRGPSYHVFQEWI